MQKSQERGFYDQLIEGGPIDLNLPEDHKEFCVRRLAITCPLKKVNNHPYDQLVFDLSERTPAHPKEPQSLDDTIA